MAKHHMPNLLSLRKKAGLTQQALASAAGVSIPTVWEAETGRSNPSVEVAAAFAAALGCTIDDLVRVQEVA